MKRNKRVWGSVGVIAVVGAVAMLLAGGLKDGVVYFLTPGEVVARGTDAVDRPLRLGGQVKPGSVQWDAEALDLRFVVQDSVGEVPVASTGAPPAMFRDGIGGVVEGSLRADGTFESTNLMVKHSNEYRKPEHGGRPGEMYKSLQKGAGT
jgi:cytochrome c-type biogenesis protein CcmE